MLTTAHKNKADLEITVHEDEVTGLWRFELNGRQIEVERRHGFVNVDGNLYEVSAVKDLEDVQDLRGKPLEVIRRLIANLEGSLDFEAPEGRHLAREEAVQAPPLESRKKVRKPTMPPRKRRKTSKKHEGAAEPREPAKPSNQDEPEAFSAFNTKEAARYTGLRPKTLETLRSRGGGPPFVKLGRRVIYRQRDLDRWISDRVRHSTSETSQAPS